MRPKKTIMHKPGFGDVGAREIYMHMIFQNKISATTNAIQEEIASICGVSLGEMIVNSMNELEELWEVEEESDEEASSVLADAEYKDADKIKVEDHSVMLTMKK